MRYSENLHLNLPEDSDPLEIDKISENFEVLDGAVSQSVGNYRIGDIIYSSRNLEEETDGVWIACDQREVLVSEYPDLCNLPFMKNRYSVTPRAHHAPFVDGTGNLKVGKPGWNTRVGERFIVLSTSTNANWNDYVSVWDLDRGVILVYLNTRDSHMYIDDSIIVTGYSNIAAHIIRDILDTGKDVSRSLSGVSYQSVQGLIRFKDKYLFVLSGIDFKWFTESEVLDGGTTSITTKTVTWQAEPGFEIKSTKMSPVALCELRMFDIPFSEKVYQCKDKLYTIKPVQNVSDPNDTSLALFSTSDGISWSQVYRLPNVPNISPSGETVSRLNTVRWALGEANGNLWLYQSLEYQYVVETEDGTSTTTHKLESLIHELNENMELLNSYEIPDYCVTINKNFFVDGDFVYADWSYLVNSGTSTTNRLVQKLDLKTGQFSDLGIPSYIYPYYAYKDEIKSFIACKLWPQISIEFNSNNGTPVSQYDFELGRTITGTGTGNKAVSVPQAILSDPFMPTVINISLWPYNSQYSFLYGLNAGNVLSIDHTHPVRVLPYMRNAYIKARNEEVSE